MKALITGVTGQDGACLAEFLLGKGYEVHGVKRRVSVFNTERIDHIEEGERFFTHYGEMTDGLSLARLIHDIRPDEVYNLGAQSHVRVSFDVPDYTADVDALGTLKLLEAIRFTGVDCAFYQASSSEMFGNAPAPQSERTPFRPRSPYAIAKLFGYWTAVNYREAYGLRASNGILFNHEGPTRGATFVSRKICCGVTEIVAGKRKTLRLGNLDARRDWGHVRDYVRGMWMMLQADPDDFVLATGEGHSVREFAERAFAFAGQRLRWEGIGPDERGYVGWEPVIEIDPRLFRPAEVECLIGDATKARERLGWSHTVSFPDLVREMMEAEMPKDIGYGEKPPKIVDEEGAKSSDSQDKLDTHRGEHKSFPRKG